MKKFLHLFMLCFLVFSCSKEEENNTAFMLNGKWKNIHESSNNLDFVQRYTFNKDNTYSQTNYYINSSTEETVGYVSYLTGTYTAIDTKLTINILEFYNITDQESDYVENIEDLELNSYTDTIGINYELQNNGNTLIFDYGPCADTAICAGNLILQKIVSN